MSAEHMLTNILEPFEVVLPLVVNVAKKTAHDVYIGRSGRGRSDSGWGNSHRMRSNSLKARIEAVTAFSDDLRTNEKLTTRLQELEGKTLGCWCAPKLCHGHVLAAAANYPDRTDELEAWMRDLRQLGDELPYRLLVTGSRTWHDEDMIRDALLAQWAAWGKPKNAVLVVGGADGADEIASQLWSRAGFPVETHAADWDNHGRRAGMVRNAEMVATGVDCAVAFQYGDTPGTRQCVDLIQRAGVPVQVHTPK